MISSQNGQFCTQTEIDEWELEPTFAALPHTDILRLQVTVWIAKTMQCLKSYYCLSKHIPGEVDFHPSVAILLSPLGHRIAAMGHHDLTVILAHFVAQKMREAHQISVVYYWYEIVARKLLLQVLKQGKNFHFSDNSFLVWTHVLFEDHPDFEYWFASKEDIRLRWLPWTAFDNHLRFKKLYFLFFFGFALDIIFRRILRT